MHIIKVQHDDDIDEKFTESNEYKGFDNKE